MSKEKNKNELDNEKRRRDELEKLISANRQNVLGQIVDANSLLPKPARVSINYQEMKEELDKESYDIIFSIAKFYVDEDAFPNVSYLKQKIKVDQIMASSLLFQMKTAEHAIVKLLTEIDEGNVAPRTFEVLSSLQRSKMEIIKHFAQFMIIVENGYKNFKGDYKSQLEENSTSVEIEEEEKTEELGFKTRGSLSLIKAVQRIREADIETKENNSSANESDF